MNILVGYDGSDESKIALDLSRRHAEAFDGKIFVLHSRVTSLPDKDFQNDELEMEEIKNDLEKGGVTCETHLDVRTLSPAEHLIQFAKEHEIDEIILGIKPSSKIEKFILGSTVKHVIEHAPCTTVIAR